MVNHDFVDRVAALLACKDATHPDFFIVLTNTLYKKGYILEARQLGIAGTYLCLTEKK